MIPVAEARARITGAMPLLPAEQVALPAAHGRVLARDVTARRTQPPLAVSAMDGYAVRAEDVAHLPATLRLVGYVQAGASHDGTLGPGEAARIFTGAPLPDGADTIVIQENTKSDDQTVTVIDGEAPVGRYVRRAGLDFAANDKLLDAGRVLTARDIGLAASMDVPWLRVRRRPRIAILATGDEIVMPGEPIGPNQIVSSNALTLAALIETWGGVAIDLGVAPDDAETLRAMAAGARGSDMLITTGGASVGDHDLIRSELGEGGLNIDFWKIAMRPGKPLMFGTVLGVPLLGLPGNPVSSLVCAVLFLAPAMRAMLGLAHTDPPGLTARLAVPLKENDEREDYLRAALTRDDHGALTARPFDAQDSSMFALTAKADGLVVRAPFAQPAATGDEVRVIPFGGGFGPV